MPVTPKFQARHMDYVLGPNQDSRLASVAAGATVKGVQLILDSDAPFVLTGRAVRQAYTSALKQNGLQFLATKWTGAVGAADYRYQDFVSEACQMANFGQCGNPGPVYPPIMYPAGGIWNVDLVNNGASAITNLTFFLRGFKVFPFGSVQGYTYPDAFKSIAYNYQIPVASLGVSELRQNQIFYVEQDDFVVRGGLATAPFLIGGESPRKFSEVGIVWKDEQRKPFSNDFVPLDVMFGAGGFPSVFPLGVTPSYIAPFGPGPGRPGLFTPEIYVPNAHQLFYDLKRTDGSGNSNQAESFTIDLVGMKVMPQ